jgi:hypothetical protein
MCLLAVTSGGLRSLSAQEPAPGRDAPAGAARPVQDQTLVVQVYRVTDLVASPRSRPYDGLQLPGSRSRMSTLGSFEASGMGGAGGGGGFGGGGSGGGGGGFFAVPDDVLSQFSGEGVTSAAGDTYEAAAARPSSGITADDLIEAITSLIAPESWSALGGPGTIVPLGGMLIVRQSAAVHAEIAELLKGLRAAGAVLRSMTVQAQWVLLNDQEFQGLLAKDADGGRRIDREALAALAETAVRYRGEATCFDNQLVHVISGRLQTVLLGTIPVVGGNEVGYQPIVERVHTGALLEVRPSLITGEDAVVLDLASYVTEWGTAEPSTQLPSGAIDRPQIVAHQLATTVRVPLGDPVLVGGLTLDREQAVQAEQPATQLYLIVEVTSTDETQPATGDRRPEAEPSPARSQR